MKNVNTRSNAESIICWGNVLKDEAIQAAFMDNGWKNSDNVLAFHLNIRIVKEVLTKLTGNEEHTLSPI